MCGKLYLQLNRMQWTQPELLCRAAIVVMQQLLELHSPAWTYSTWAHYSCASKGPCQKGATKEVNRQAFIFIIIRGGTLCIKVGKYFSVGFFYLSGNWMAISIHPYPRGKTWCTSFIWRRYIWFNVNHILAPIFEKVTLGPCFCPWIIFERPILEANRGRLDVRDVPATCEMGIRLLVKAMKRWFWNGNKSGRKSNGKGDYNIKAGGHIPAQHKRLP